MTLVISSALKLVLVCVVTEHFLVCRGESVNSPVGIRHGNHRRISTSNNRSVDRVAALYRAGPSGGQSAYQRDEGSRGQAMDQPMMVPDFEEEEERYVPASFNIDDYGGPNHGNGFFNGHAIEMMAPVEVPEYGWHEESSRGLSELENGEATSDQHSPRRSDPIPYSAGRPAAGGLIQCGEKQIDPTYGLCCNDLVYRKSAEDQGKCCGSVAYDDRFFTCCQGRAIVRKGPQLPLCCGDYTRDSLPDQCRFGYERDNTGLGSTCCRSASGSWSCCLKGESCCTGSAVDRSTAIEVPGFRPACCHLTNEDLTAQCCATTYEKIRVLPDCCRRDKLKPVCCQRKDASRPIKCCPGTIGYCCGQDERPVQPTAIVPPEFRLHSTRAPHFTYPQRPAYTHRPMHPPRSTYAPRPPTYPPRLTYPPRPSFTQRPSYTQRSSYAPVPSYTTRYPFPIEGYSVTPRDRLLHSTPALPSCCTKKTPLRQCCSSTKSPTCCQSARILPRCCFTIYFNPSCCRSQMQQQQQQQLQQQQPQQQQQRIGRETSDSSHNSTSLDVIPVDAVHAGSNGNSGSQREPSQPVDNGQLPNTAPHDAHGALRQRNELSSDANNGGQPQAIVWSKSRSSDGRFTDSGLQVERQTVALSCCRLDAQAATACCREGYQESGRLPECCVSSPVEHLEPNDADPTLLNQDMSPAHQELRLGDSDSQVSRRPRRAGQRNPSKDVALAKVGPSKLTGRKIRNNNHSGRPCNETSFEEDEFMCCNNILRKRVGVSPSCCNTVAYDQLLYKCCDGKVRVSCRHDYKPKKSVWGVPV